MVKGTGKLYNVDGKEVVSTINYDIYEKPETEDSTGEWYGELTLDQDIWPPSKYIIELEDKRKSTCHLKKRVNRAVSGIPPRYVYHVTGFSPIK